MFVNHEKEFVYIAIPKTGSYSIHDFLCPGARHPEPNQHHVGVRELDPTLFGYYKFAFVRNPWAKLVSVYTDFTLRRGNNYSGLVRTHHALLSEFESFKDMCLRLHDSPWFDNIFFRPQVDSVFYSNGTPIDFIGRLENINEDFRTVCDHLQLRYRPLARANKGTYDVHYRSFYDNESMDAVAELYSRDISVFNYDF